MDRIINKFHILHLFSSSFGTCVYLNLWSPRLCGLLWCDTIYLGTYFSKFSWKTAAGCFRKADTRLKTTWSHNHQGHNMDKSLLLTYLLTHSLTHLLNYLLTFLLTYILTYLFTYLLTYLLTPWNCVLLDMLIGFQLVKKFPEFHGTRRFITTFTGARHLSPSWASSIQYITPYPTSWRFNLLLSTHLHLGHPSGLFPSGFPIKPCIRLSSHPYLLHIPPISFFSMLSL